VKGQKYSEQREAKKSGTNILLILQWGKKINW